jgi:hypothetical protein
LWYRSGVARAPLTLKKVGTIVLPAFLAFTAFYAESFVIAHLDHEHDHDGADGTCSLCSELERVILLVEGLGRIACAVFAAFGAFHSAKPIAAMAAVYRAGPTLLALKVRLNP